MHAITCIISFQLQNFAQSTDRSSKIYVDNSKAHFCSVRKKYIHSLQK